MTSPEILSEMAGIGNKHSNLNVKLWVGFHGGSKHYKPYVKVMLHGENQSIASISIGDPNIVLAGDINKLTKQQIRKIREFIILNKDTLLYYYYNAGEEGFDPVNDLYLRLQKV